jgi:hypothetical protein
MAEVDKAQLEAAEARVRHGLAAEPRASAARYDPATGRVVVDLVNGCSYLFPARLFQDLQGASDAAPIPTRAMADSSGPRLPPPVAPRNRQATPA